MRTKPPPIPPEARFRQFRFYLIPQRGQPLNVAIHAHEQRPRPSQRRKRADVSQRKLERFYSQRGCPRRIHHTRDFPALYVPQEPQRNMQALVARSSRPSDVHAADGGRHPRNLSPRLVRRFDGDKSSDAFAWFSAQLYLSLFGLPRLLYHDTLAPASEA